MFGFREFLDGRVVGSFRKVEMEGTGFFDSKEGFVVFGWVNSSYVVRSLLF